MAMFKCKMCGGDLDVNEEIKVVECEYCGTKQTIPSMDNEKKINLFNRANRLRFANEFDKAAGVYESIAAEFPEEAEAYWGLCLCKYGIEYVDDPATGKKIPTCHRTSFDGIFNDSNFELALEYSDSVAVSVYREEAKEIDRLQKAILDIANKEEPFDIFICYKETAEDGQRTKDSVLAQDMYDKLTEKGYKVFFARITLEDKLGQEYEPYIFSALNSAKIMLAIGTKYEYYNAVWVKNEWSRFLDMMKKDKEKVLIPCYADIDAYDMPQEFKNLQGQDMGKVGFMQDLVRGIGKIIPIEAEKPVAVAPVQTVVQQVVVNSNVENLLKRGNLALEEGNWDEANNFFDRMLDENAEDSRAYLGKILAKFKSNNESEFIKNARRDVLTDDYDYKKAYRYGDEKTRRKLEEFNLAAAYNYATHRVQEADNMPAFYKSRKLDKITELKYVEEILRKLGNYKESAKLLEVCRQEIQDEIDKKEEKSKQEEMWRDKAEKFKENIIKYLSEKNYYVSWRDLTEIISHDIDEFVKSGNYKQLVGSDVIKNDTMDENCKKYLNKLVQEDILESDTFSKSDGQRYQVKGFDSYLTQLKEKFKFLAQKKISEIREEIENNQQIIEENKFKLFGTGAEIKARAKEKIEKLTAEITYIENDMKHPLMTFMLANVSGKISNIYIKEGQIVQVGENMYTINGTTYHLLGSPKKILAVETSAGSQVTANDTILFINMPAKLFEWGLIKE